jgi:DNA polymerase-3 subunit delta
MTPDQFLRQVKQGEIAPAYLFAGHESYRRDQCRRALVEAVLGKGDEVEEGLTRHDLDEMTLAEVIEEASVLSLFAPRRLIWVASAESALPKGRAAAAAAAEDEAGDSGRLRPEDVLGRYMANPTPGVVIVFQASRYGFEGEDKAKSDRVRKFYAAVGREVEFPAFSPQEARQLATELAGKVGLKLGSATLDYLVESLGASAERIAIEMEKLLLFRGPGAAITEADIEALAPDARESTIFALVAAMGRRDRQRSLEILNTLIREGEYLPLALNFLGTQFRQALVVREAGLKNPQQVQAHFTRLGTPMWRTRAEQVCQTAAAFPREKLSEAIRQVFQADRSLRDTRPDDRTIMERLILELTTKA